jgi:hypothetical protein
VRLGFTHGETGLHSVSPADLAGVLNGVHQEYSKLKVKRVSHAGIGLRVKYKSYNSVNIPLWKVRNGNKKILK